MLGWIDLKLWMAVCWKVSWNVDPLPLSVPERPELPPPPPPDEPQAATNKAIAARASPATVNRCLCRPCMSDTPPFLGCHEHQTPPGPKPGMRTVLPRRVCRAGRTRELSEGIRSAKYTETKDERKVIETWAPGVLTAAAGTPDTAGHAGPIPGTTLVAGLCRGFGLLPTVGCSVNVGNRGSCISVATEISLAQLRRAKAMMPTMAKPTPFMLVPLIIAGRMITRSRPNPE